MQPYFYIFQYKSKLTFISCKAAIWSYLVIHWLDNNIKHATMMLDNAYFVAVIKH